MDILIKSFNRPFYLDRCIASIYQNITGDFKIKILDDGTPKKYLNKIKAKYPNVEIYFSDNYEEKAEAIHENLISGKSINGFEIPTKFWYEAVKKSSKYVIVTEDDVWFTFPVNIDTLIKEAEEYHISLIKLGWLGNHADIKKLITQPISENLESSQPKELLFFNEKLMSAFFYNKYKFFSILYKLGRVDNDTQRKYWALNSILMGFFNKNYWLAIWTGMEGKVDEKKQLVNASIYYKKHKNNPYFISKLKVESMKTTFQSSATNSYHEYGFDFDVNRFNHIINEAWFKDNFDVMQNFPKDFSLDYFKNFISEEINLSEFEKWTTKFRKQYEEIGCTIE